MTEAAPIRAAPIRAAPIRAAPIIGPQGLRPQLVPLAVELLVGVGAHVRATYMWACTKRAINLFSLIVDFVF